MLLGEHLVQTLDFEFEPDDLIHRFDGRLLDNPRLLLLGLVRLNHADTAHLEGEHENGGDHDRQEEKKIQRQVRRGIDVTGPEDI